MKKYARNILLAHGKQPVGQGFHFKNKYLKPGHCFGKDMGLDEENAR